MEQVSELVELSKLYERQVESLEKEFLDACDELSQVLASLSYFRKKEGE